MFKFFTNRLDTTRADRARDKGNWNAASQLYRQILDIDGNLPHIWVQYGHSLKESGNVDGAIEAYKRALKIDDTQPDSWLQLGHALKLSKAHAEAESAYVRALTLAPTSTDIRRELLGMGWSPRQVQNIYKKRNRAEPSIDLALFGDLTVVFDVSDLCNYFANARVPTGIQRVQINIITSLLSSVSKGQRVHVVCFTTDSDNWVEIEPKLLLRLADLSIESGDLDEPVWRKTLTDLRWELDVGVPFAFPAGSALVNLGTSWWLNNYFLRVREAKAQYGIKYIPFIHDLIPVMTPEHCTPELTKDFINWLLGVFQHADGYLVNSNATAADLVKVAAILGFPPPDFSVIKLDGDCRTVAGKLEQSHTPKTAPSLVQSILDGGEYILFVSTIESRKNHLLAFDAWLLLLKTRGKRNTPALICVGNPGWLVDAALARLESSTLLKNRVRILSKVSDEELAALYRNSLFTLYPSSYEGWGLPVTEALCFGKIPLISRVSSLPEAGGVFAEYFNVHSVEDLVEKLTRLLDDGAYRKTLEERIRREFQPRPWAAISEQVAREVNHICESNPGKRLVTTVPSQDSSRGFIVETGRYYSLARNTETSIYLGMTNGEIFRMGHGWAMPDDWGNWLCETIAKLKIRLPGLAEREHIFYIGLLGLPAESQKSVRYEIKISPGTSISRGVLQTGQTRWVKLPIHHVLSDDNILTVTIVSDISCALADVTNGVDKRNVSLGVYGFGVARADDIAQRLDFIEALQFGCLDRLSGRPNDAP